MLYLVLDGVLQSRKNLTIYPSALPKRSEVIERFFRCRHPLSHSEKQLSSDARDFESELAGHVPTGFLLDQQRQIQCSRERNGVSLARIEMFSLWRQRPRRTSYNQKTLELVMMQIFVGFFEQTFSKLTQHGRRYDHFII